MREPQVPGSYDRLYAQSHTPQPHSLLEYLLQERRDTSAPPPPGHTRPQSVLDDEFHGLDHFGRNPELSPPTGTGYPQSLGFGAVSIPPAPPVPGMMRGSAVSPEPSWQGPAPGAEPSTHAETPRTPVPVTQSIPDENLFDRIPHAHDLAVTDLERGQRKFARAVDTLTTQTALKNLHDFEALDSHLAEGNRTRAIRLAEHYGEKETQDYAAG